MAPPREEAPSEVFTAETAAALGRVSAVVVKMLGAEGRFLVREGRPQP